MRSTTPDARGELRLPPSAESARLARRHVRAVLTAAGRDDWAEDAELAVSEVVTNGVLHAHTALVLRVEVREDCALLEVQDGNPTLPMPRRTPGDDSAADTATTGRGLALLTAVTLDRGVRHAADGKVVWFTVGSAAPTAAVPPPPAATADTWTPEQPPPEGDGQAVVLRAMPTVLWTAAREHHQSLLRELVLYLAEHGAELPHTPDLVQADAARQLLWTSLLRAMDAAPGDAGPVDLPLRVPPDLAHAFGAFQDALDVAERLAAQDLLLVRPGLPEIVAVRDWACDQVVAQLAGVAPSPWPGMHQERFTVVTPGDRPGRLGWDASAVTASDRAVVAADEANRIVAASPALAGLTGWDLDDLVGRRLVALVPPRLREAHVAGFSRHVSTGVDRLIGAPLELPVLHRDGRELPCRVLLERAANTSRPVYLGWVDPLST